MQAGAFVSAILIAVSVAAAPAAAQQTAGEVVEAPLPPPDPDAIADPPPQTPLTPEEAAALGNALNFDFTSTASTTPVKPPRLPGLPAPDKFDVSAKPDGAGTMSYYRPFAGDWSAKVGADLAPAPTRADGYRPDKPLPVIGGDFDSGAAWASVGVANLATVDARLDPTSDQSKLGTTFKRSIPVGKRFSLTLQDSYSVTQTIGAPAATPSAVPLMVAPGGTATAPAPQVWGSQKALKFDVLSTGTTFGAGITTASNDPNSHGTFSADQKLYGPLHVTTSVTDFGQSTANKSITARFKLSW